MGFTVSRSARISLLLVIDVAFFFVELIVGYAVGSLALIADSFHMLNDVMSLVVALYAIKLTAQTEVDSRYSYGWHRAEILAALINGVFLLALCFSISLEAFERFFSTPEISNPKLVVIVGTLGLASNIVGLFLFHEHGHSHSHSHDAPSPLPITGSSPLIGQSNSGDATPTQKPRARSPSPERSHSRSDSYSSLYGHPAATRASLVQTAHELGAFARSPSPPRRLSHSHSRPRSSLECIDPSGYDRTSALPTNILEEDSGEVEADTASSNESAPLLDRDHDHDTQNEVYPNNVPKGEGHRPHSHSHAHAGSMNMRALLLHVLGDALGNVGVIATGLVIWLSNWSFKFYFDPVVSLVITVIIFSSALPLVRSASFILLQGVPATISLDDVRDSILDVDGVLSLHELHVWQLSETKIIASVHVLASRNHDFMPVASKIRKALHHHGIHSSTIQPEYAKASVPEEHIMSSENTSCLILCPPDQECNPQDHACCPPPPTTA